MKENNVRKIVPKELDLGKRKVSRMNFSNVVTLPQTFVKNCLGNNMEVKMTMLEDGCLKITPIVKQTEVKSSE